jgi:hypothetical protein
MSLESVSSNQGMELRRPPHRVVKHVTAVLDEQRHLQALQRRLREMCSALTSTDTNRGYGPRNAASLLSEWQSQLAALFAIEEREDYFGTIVANWPSLIWRVAELRADHTAILEAIATLTCFASDSDESAEVASRALGLMETLRQHEEGETRLMQEFLELEQQGRALAS